MSDPKSKSHGNARKRVADPQKASRVLEELRNEHQAQLEGSKRRRELALEAAELGLTTTGIAHAIGSKQTTVSLWIRRARDERE